MSYLQSLQGEIVDEWRVKSRNSLYKTDPEAWVYDRLGSRWHLRQREVAHSFMTTPRTLVKSGNGSGKSRQVAELMCWATSVFEIGEVLSIASAPTMRQVEEVLFAYVKDNYGRAKAMGMPLPGEIRDSVKWIYRESSKDAKKTLAIGMKPSDTDIVGTFQGIRSVGEHESGTKTFVFIDEAGGVPSDLFTAAAAVTTGAGNKIMGIGNPDRTGTEFHSIFQKEERKEKHGWSLHTISVFDLPTITGEIVYPDDPTKQHAMVHNSGMNDQDWVDQAAISWGEESARYRSKVLGEFPDSDDRSFFPQSALDIANDTKIFPEEDCFVRIGADVARFGEDDSMVYINLDGHIRFNEKWSKAPTTESTSRIHSIAKEHGAHEVVIDAAGVGGGIADGVSALASSLPGGGYSVVKTLGAYASPDPTVWLNARAYWYDKFREAMQQGKVDLDLTVDTQLRDELLVIQYDYTPKGQIKIESKADMAARGVKSPDALDAVIYSFISNEIGRPGAPEGLNNGDKVYVDPYEMAGVYDMAGLPI